MPTLNLGRVRFNWRGAYDPLTDYLEYDCVEDDGQSYVCIAAVTGTGPNEAGGATYWGSMLIRSAAYNQARDDAIAAADAAGDSATAAASSESTATGAASTATAARDKAQEWAEKMGGEVEPGLRSARYWAEEAQNFGDPNLLDVTADQTSDTRQLNEWTAQILTTQQTANSYQGQIDTANDNADAALLASSENSTDIASLVAVTATAIIKADGSQAAWTAPTSFTLETASALALVVGSAIVEIAAGTAVTLPTLAAGTDYTIYASTAGTLQAVDADSAAPAGERVVGGFHVSAGGTAIVDSSLWDLNWRPASEPRAMVLSLDGRVWADIYLCDVDYALNGYSRNGQQIADGNSLPKIPTEYGGDGTATYSSGSWWSFNDIFSAAGKRFPCYQEFTALAYGVVERQAVGTDPGTTQHQAGHRSACGVEQATGVMYQWGADLGATAGSAWQNIADGRGDIYASNLKAPLFGANWTVGASAGSRASTWNNAPDSSVSGIGSRAVSDHLNLQAER